MPIISSFSNQFKPVGGNLVVINDLILPPSNDFTYSLIPNNDLTFTLIPTNDLNYVEIPNNDILYGFIPDNDINYVTIPNNDSTYTLIPNNDSTYTLIPNNDIEYSVLKPPAVFYGLITYSEEPEDCDCSRGGCISSFYATGDGPTFCESNNFATNGDGFGYNGYGYISYAGYYRSVNVNNTNIATYRGDCLSCPTPTPTPTPTSTPTSSLEPCSSGFTISNCGTSHVYTQNIGVPWTSYGENYLQVGPSQDGGGLIAPQAGWYFVDDCGRVRQLLNTPIWISGGQNSPWPNGSGWLCVVNAPFTLGDNVQTLTFCESMPIVGETPTPTATSTPTPTATSTPTPNLEGFSYSNFASTTGLVGVGNAQVISNIYYLTTASNSQVGNVYRTTAIQFNRNFSTQWSTFIGDGTGADGYCVQWTPTNNSNGAIGGGVGILSTATNAITFLTHTNNNYTWYKNNVSQGINSVTAGLWRQTLYFWGDYNHSAQTFTLYWNTTNSKPGSANKTFTSFSFDTGSYYMGFGAATGGANDNHRLLSWSLQFT